DRFPAIAGTSGTLRQRRSSRSPDGAKRSANAFRHVLAKRLTHLRLNEVIQSRGIWLMTFGLDPLVPRLVPLGITRHYDADAVASRLRADLGQRKFQRQKLVVCDVEDHV